MSKIRKLLESIDKLNEASEITFDELEQQAKEFIQRMEFEKMDKHIFSLKDVTFLDGLRGTIMSVGDKSTLRLDKEDLKKMIADKSFRWIDVKSLGF